jgi:hypothetical protein
MKQLTSSSHALDGAKAVDRARWAAIDSFGVVPWELKIDKEWLEALKAEPLCSGCSYVLLQKINFAFTRFFEIRCNITSRKNGRISPSSGGLFPGRITGVRGKFKTRTEKGLAEPRMVRFPTIRRFWSVLVCCPGKRENGMCEDVSRFQGREAEMVALEHASGDSRRETRLNALIPAQVDAVRQNFPGHE